MEIRLTLSQKRMWGRRITGSLLFMVMATTCLAQQQDTTSNVRLNPIAIKNITAEIKPERFKIVHFIAPAVLIGYGFATVCSLRLQSQYGD